MPLQGINDDVYTLTSRLGGGGEGEVYRTSNNLVAKIYKPEKLCIDLERKITHMVNHPPSRSVLQYMAWPLDILYDNGDFCGFVMTDLSGYTPLSEIHDYSVNTSKPMQLKLQVALNLSMMIQEIHKAGYIIGDINPDNIGFNENNGIVCFYDNDSFTVIDSDGHEYKCIVGVEDFIAPEVMSELETVKRQFLSQGITKKADFSDLPHGFDLESDNFALATNIFQLMNNGCKPYSAITSSSSQSTSPVSTAAIKSSTVAPKPNQNMMNNHYCYSPGYKPFSAQCLLRSEHAPYIISMFDRAFHTIDGNNSRPSADEWVKTITKYKNDIKSCPIENKHLFYKNLSSCSYCEANNRKRQSVPVKPIQQPVYIQPSGNQNNTVTQTTYTPPSPKGNYSSNTNNYKSKSRIPVKGIIAVVAIIIVAAIAIIALGNGGNIVPSETYTSVSTTEELQSISGDGRYSIEADIDMKDVDWTTMDFSGKIKGNGHSISNLSKPLFKKMSGSITDINITNVNIAGSSTSVIANENTGTIEKVRITGNMNISGTDYCGGFAVSSSGTIKDCTSELNINGSAPVGGICGTNTGKLINVTNNGSIKSTADHVAGIAGYIKSGSVDNATNNGSIEGRDYVGGLYTDTAEGVKLNKSTNLGNVTGRNYVGGIAAYRTAGSSEDNYADNCTIKGSSYVGGICGCYNSKSDWTSDGAYNIKNITIYGDQYVGGLTGYYHGTITDLGEFSGTIKNNSTTTTENAYIGGIIGYIEGTINNAKSNIEISVTNKGNYTGGIVGYAILTSNTSNLKNTGNITANGDYVGGIIGATSVNTDSYISMTNCSNTGLLTTVGSYIGGIVGYSSAQQYRDGGVFIDGSSSTSDISGNTYVGGIAGGYLDALKITNTTFSKNVTGTYYVGGIAGAATYIEDCVMNGNVTSTGKNTNGNSCLGGIVGDLTGTINDCTNNGSVTSTSNGNDVGGIAGWALLKNNSDTLKNTGNITANGDYVGGIIGVTSVNTDSYISMTNCSNTGLLTTVGSYIGGIVGYSSAQQYRDGGVFIDGSSSTSDISGNTYVGGIAGGYLDALKITNTTFSKNVTGTYYVGGIAGAATYIEDCVMNGNVTSTGKNTDGNTQLGGIAGYISGSINNCTNNGSITSTSDGENVGGITGYISISSEISNLTNNGDVNSNSNCVGGIFGYIYTNKNITIQNCTNNHSISIPSGSYIGGIAGFIKGYSSPTVKLLNCNSSGAISGSSSYGQIYGGSANITITTV